MAGAAGPIAGVEELGVRSRTSGADRRPPDGGRSATKLVQLILTMARQNRTLNQLVKLSTGSARP